MNLKIMRQLEQLMDFDSGVNRDIIVQFRSDRSDKTKRFLEAAVDTERNRSMMVDPLTCYRLNYWP